MTGKDKKKQYRTPGAGLPVRKDTASARRPRASVRGRAGPALTCPLPHSLAAPGRARRLTRRLLDRWGLDGDFAARVEVLVSELVTNAVCHALPDLRITWRMLSRDGRTHVRVEVADGGPARGSSVCSDRPSDERGRGTLVMDALASGHGMERCGTGGTLHWVEVAAPWGSTAGPHRTG
ncbi:ATP-binding protein [Streptomyces sp. NPDC006393]|uniref:ATP-binding protein n=1 Tax=Streptomyces sp. NPDC006393 TaxID=3156763 RepID=UPI0033DD4A52